MLEHLDTATLRKAHTDLLHPIPGDPSFLASVGNLLRSLIQRELSSPERVEADKKAVEEEFARREKAREEARKAELEAVAHDKEATAEVKAKHDAEEAQAAKQVKLASIAESEAKDRADLEEHYRKQRESLVAA